MIGSLLLLTGVAGRALSHPLDVGALTATETGDGFDLSLDLSVPFWQKLTDAPPDAPPPQTGEVLAATLQSGGLTIDGLPCQLTASDLQHEGDRLLLSAHASCPHTEGALLWNLPFIERGTLSFRLLTHLQRGAAARDRILEPGAHSLTDAGSSRRGFLDFVGMGIHHIGATPDEWFTNGRLHFPEGIDHILFLLALLLINVGLRSVLKTVTGFTVGHSVTLSLAALGFVKLPVRLIESTIALTIAYVAAEDVAHGVKNRKVRPRWQVAVVFGLIHGFGFARALSDLHLPHSRLLGALVGFNLGVEIGQLIIVALVAPLLWLLFRHRWFARFGAPALAAGIFVAAMVWFVQRAFF